MSQRGSRGYQQLYYSPTYGLMTVAPNFLGDEMVWVFEMMNRVSLRTLLDSGPDSNPPLPDDAVALIPTDAITEYRVIWDGEAQESLPDSTYPTREAAQERFDRLKNRIPGIKVVERAVTPEYEWGVEGDIPGVPIAPMTTEDLARGLVAVMSRTPRKGKLYRRPVGEWEEVEVE